MEGFEDAGVYKLNEDLAIIQTLDFFTPIVDDPYTFGQVAAANALSDVYAMGGRPLTAMNIICFPVKKMDIAVLQQILRGGLDKITEAGVTLVGGHSVEDDEIKYGLSVTGVIHPQKVLRNRGAQVGDKLILTKPLGTGIVSTAIKGGVAEEFLTAESIQSMITLNKKAGELIAQTPEIHACTDVTGFGFIGHTCEMIENTEVGMVVHATSVPYFQGIQKLIAMGMIPGGLYRNKNFRLNMVEIDPHCPEWIVDLLFDPQTSGGLLVALPATPAEKLIKTMRARDVNHATIVGDVVASPKGKIRITSL
jgi:selenide,water dikinase